MPEQIDSILHDLRDRLASLYGGRLNRVVLFGSQARQDANAGSDIDVLVVLNGQVLPTREIARTGALVAELSLHYAAVISCTFVSADRYAEEESPLLMNVRREGRIVA